MNISKRVKYGSLVGLVLALAVGLLAGLGQGHLQAGPASAAGPDGTMAVDCDGAQPGVQSACTHAPGSTFNVEIHVMDPPDTKASGYFFFQVKLQWQDGVLNYQPTVAPSGEVLWPNCTIPARSDNAPDPTVLVACVPLPALTAGSTFTGAILSFEFQCKADPQAPSPPAGLDTNQSLTELVPEAGDPQGGTHFGTETASTIAPNLDRATVTCAEVTPPPPTDTPVPGVPTDTPVPGAPTATEVPAVESELTEDAMAGDTEITVGDASEFNVGDTIIIGSGDTQEEAVIASIDGNVLTLESPLAFDHPAGTSVVVPAVVEPTAIATPILPTTGSGGSNGSSAGLWIAFGLLLAAAGAGLSAAGWRFARSRSLTS